MGFDQAKAGRLDADFIAFDEVRPILAAQLVAPLAADGDDPDILALGKEGGDLLSRRAHDAGIERTGQAAVGSGDHHQMTLIAPGACQQQRCRRS